MENCTKFGDFIFRKIIATRCHILRRKCTKFYLGKEMRGRRGGRGEGAPRPTKILPTPLLIWPLAESKNVSQRQSGCCVVCKCWCQAEACVATPSRRLQLPIRVCYRASCRQRPAAGLRPHRGRSTLDRASASTSASLTLRRRTTPTTATPVSRRQEFIVRCVVRSTQFNEIVSISYIYSPQNKHIQIKTYRDKFMQSLEVLAFTT